MAMVCSLYGNEHRQLKRRTLFFSVIDLILIASTIAFVIFQLITISIGPADGSDSDVVLNERNQQENDSNVGGGVMGLGFGAEAHDSSKEKSRTEVSKDEYDQAPDPKEYNYNNPSEEDEGRHNNNLEDYHNQNNHEFQEDVNSGQSKSRDNCNPNSTSVECIKGRLFDKNIVDDWRRTATGARISLSIQLIIYFSQLGFGVLLFIAAYHNDSQNLHMWVLFSEVIVVVVGLILFINLFGKFYWLPTILTGIYILFKIFLIRLVRKFIHVNDLQLTQFGSVGEFD